ncbi:amidase [Roseixanthobacter liquoris]|uniref:amidase n=1 Tax=Roseixanthobacter liquoris TaxID=3119921 RepID=UPI003728FDC1
MTALKTSAGVLDIVHALAAGEALPQDLIAASHARALALEGALHAFAHLPAEAPAATPGAGPLTGVAVGVKDLIATADMPTTYGSAVYADHQPAEDAYVVGRLKDLGATILGKTITTEFAWREPGPTRNPWNLGHTPGGSSSGSAASVASGSVQVALGTQTLGSILRPAAYCGVVGLKPSYGTIALKGVHDLSQSLDHLGLFARSVDDAAYVLSLLAGGPGAARRTIFPFGVAGVAPFPAPRIAWLLPAGAPALEDSQTALMEMAAARLAGSGATVQAVTLPEAFAQLPAISATLCGAEGAANFGALVARFPDKTSARLQGLVERGAAIAATDYLAARAAQLALRTAFTHALSGFDAVLTAPATGEAPEGLGETGDPGLCVPWTTLGVPAIAVPAGTGPRGLPLGIQLVAPFGEDVKLLRIAKWCETALAYPARIAPGV